MGAAIGEVLGLAAGSRSARCRMAAPPDTRTSGLANQLGPAHLQADLDDAVDAFTAGERHTPPSSTGSPLGG
jgi:hypothetical protein